jgi:hypothetical protein
MSVNTSAIAVWFGGKEKFGRLLRGVAAIVIVAITVLVPIIAIIRPDSTLVW